MSDKFNTTEDLMEHLKKQIIQFSNGEEVEFENSLNQQVTIPNGDIDLTRLKQEIERNNLLWNVSADQPITSHRKASGKFIVFGKKIVRKFLRWYVSNPFKDQAEFNGSITRSFNETTNLLVVAKAKIAELTASQQELLNRMNLMEERLPKQWSVIDEKVFRQNDLIENYKNGINIKLEELKSEIELLTTNEDILNINNKIDSIQEELQAITAEAIEQKNTLNTFIFPKLDEVNGKIHYNEQKLKSELNFLNYRIRKSKSALFKKESLPSMELNLGVNVADTSSQDSQFDYLLFENRFRGSNEDIRNRQLKYLPYFENKENVIDIGCGRGEFLELLLNNNISAKGIDLTDEMVEYCQDLGLPVDKQDALIYLEQQNDNSIGGIFLGQVIEHMPFDNIIRLVEISWQKLKPGCYLIMETPNPQTLAIFNRSFYMDPTHVKPVHPLTVQFLTESVGFRESNLIYSGRVERENALPHIQAAGDVILNIEEFNHSIDRLNDLLFGDQDYALIARK
ncbi:O-antigen chain-terminating methyltransferase [Paenibacillus forsythiae]|uniref:O-antigen chain-terminating methyltransferase n=1 Tax=Paenibacillus forsythiae TaxID=365616 RepID=A0ABU3HBA3_9BACL|nr:class I SAM-dependent methyltransferase [Paenibacillus forsythiae]MDT3428095.1 O-antigen chain-terminating methyltransferase [Paenibacillus forsythiae]